MKKIIILCFLICLVSSVVYTAPVYYNYKKEAFKGDSQINFSKIDMKNINEVNLTFVGMEFNAQGWADFIALDKPVTLYASCSTDLRVRYKNRPSYEYDAKINKKDIHFKAKNYFYWNSYLQLMLLPDKKHATNLRCKFNGIENTLSSYIVEKADAKDDSRTFKFIKRVTNKVESLDFSLAKDLNEIPSKLEYCSSNLVACRYNVHFGSAKPLFKKRGNPNEIKDVTVTFYATIQSVKSSDGNIINFKTAPKPNDIQVIKTTPTTKQKNTNKKKNITKNKPVAKPNSKAENKITVTNSTNRTNSDINSASIVNTELAPRTDDELDEDLGAEVIFVSGPENSLKDERSIAPRTDSELDNDLVGE